MLIFSQGNQFFYVKYIYIYKVLYDVLAHPPKFVVYIL